METKELIKTECELDNVTFSTEKKHISVVDKRKIVIIAILLFTMLLSIFVVPLVVDKIHIIESAQETLETKKDAVVAITATAATVSVAVAAMPGDSTTPLANQIAELDIFFIIVLIAIYMLKILLFASTSLSFKFLFPIACALLVAYVLSNISYLKRLAIKLIIFGLVIFLTVPISVKTMNVVDTALKTQEKIETVAIDEAIDTETSVEVEDEEKNWWLNFWDNVVEKAKEVSNKVTTATKEMYQKAKNKFSELVDIVASLIITCCVIPLLVVIFLVWILKILFGINIQPKTTYDEMHKTLQKILIRSSNEED